MEVQVKIVKNKILKVYFMDKKQKLFKDQKDKMFQILWELSLIQNMTTLFLHQMDNLIIKLTLMAKL